MNNKIYPIVLLVSTHANFTWSTKKLCFLTTNLLKLSSKRSGHFSSPLIIKTPQMICSCFQMHLLIVLLFCSDLWIRTKGVFLTFWLPFSFALKAKLTKPLLITMIKEEWGQLEIWSLGVFKSNSNRKTFCMSWAFEWSELPLIKTAWIWGMLLRLFKSWPNFSLKESLKTSPIWSTFCSKRKLMKIRQLPRSNSNLFLRIQVNSIQVKFRIFLSPLVLVINCLSFGWRTNSNLFTFDTKSPRLQVNTLVWWFNLWSKQG